MTINELKEKVNDPIITDHDEIEKILREIALLPARSIYDREVFRNICDWLGDVGQDPKEDVQLCELMDMVGYYCSRFNSEYEKTHDADYRSLMNALVGKCLFFDKSIILRTVHTRRSRCK